MRPGAKLGHCAKVTAFGWCESIEAYGKEAAVKLALHDRPHVLHNTGDDRQFSWFVAPRDLANRAYFGAARYDDSGIFFAIENNAASCSNLCPIRDRVAEMVNHVVVLPF